jgi:hypothetical protein
MKQTCKTIILAALILFSSMATASQSKDSKYNIADDFNKLLTEISTSKNLLQFENTERKIQAYVKSIESATDSDGIRYAAVTLVPMGLISGNKPSIVYPIVSEGPSGITWICGMDIDEAKTLQPGQFVTLQAKILQVITEQRIISGLPFNHLTAVSACKN